jgi:multidrug resistance efflux pump
VARDRHPAREPLPAQRDRVTEKPQSELDRLRAEYAKAEAALQRAIDEEARPRTVEKRRDELAYAHRRLAAAELKGKW